MIIDIFPTKIYKREFPRELNESETNKIKELLDDFVPNRFNKTSRDNFVLSNHDEFNELKEFFQVNINQYTKNVFNLPMSTKVHITQSWLNLTAPNQQHHLHNHPNSFVSGVFYPKTVKNDTISFKNPNIAAQTWLPEKGSTNSYMWINVNAGDLLLFPSWLEHKVDTNITEDERISLSFNTFISGKIGNKRNLAYLEL
jgi:uncharacterized protein (TIGR02466 family)